MTAVSRQLTALRDFQFDDEDFERIRALVKESAGISLSDAKRDMVYSRLARRLRALRIGSFKEYLELVVRDEGGERGNFINAITTNLTAFFREAHHFEYLKATFIPYLLKARRDTRRVRIWSAGCSTGPEPYSIAMTLLESGIVRPGWDVKILATDLDTNVLKIAEEGVYGESALAPLDGNQLRKWFRRGRKDKEGLYRVVPELRSLITFKQLNLMDRWPMRGPFDVLFCRNVIIYFDKPTQKVLFDRFAQVMADDGVMFLGHSESLYRVSTRFTLLGQTIYKKAERGHHEHCE